MKQVITIVTLSLLLMLTACGSSIEDTNVAEEKVEPSSIVFETVAHIPENQFPDYTRVWFDEETDRALYIINDYVPKQVVDIGDTVVFNDLNCQVINTDEQGFEVQLPDDALAAYGMSGSTVYYGSVPIAMISRATSVNTVYAVYY